MVKKPFGVVLSQVELPATVDTAKLQTVVPVRAAAKLAKVSNNQPLKLSSHSTKMPQITMMSK